MCTFNINEIIEAVKFSGLVSFDKGNEKELYDKLNEYEESNYDNQYNYIY